MQTYLSNIYSYINTMQAVATEYFWDNVYESTYQKQNSYGIRIHSPPFFVLNLIPKSLSGPPGLWLAVRIIPPVVFLFLIRFDTAGVETIPCWPTITFLTCRNTKTYYKQWRNVPTYYWKKKGKNMQQSNYTKGTMTVTWILMVSLNLLISLKNGGRWAGPLKFRNSLVERLSSLFPVV